MPTLVFAGMPPGDALAQTLQPHFTLAHHPQRAHYVTRLVDQLAALIIVDPHHPDWEYFISTAKRSPATRRIPIVVIGEESFREAVQNAGADFLLDPSALTVEWIEVHRRVIDPAQSATLDCQCAEALPELAQRGVERFNAGDFYAQHDLFEELWMATEGPVRDLYRAILQVGIAYYQITLGNRRGAHKMLLRSVQWLAALPDVCQGVDVAALREDAARVRAALERLPSDQIADFDRRLFMPIKRR